MVVQLQKGPWRAGGLFLTLPLGLLKAGFGDAELGELRKEYLAGGYLQPPHSF